MNDMMYNIFMADVCCELVREFGGIYDLANDRFECYKHTSDPDYPTSLMGPPDESNSSSDSSNSNNDSGPTNGK